MPTRSPARRFKDAIYEQFARVAKALASPHRIQLLDLLAQGSRTVEALGRMADMSLANTSAHLQVMRAAGLLEATKDGLYVTYRVADSEGRGAAALDPGGDCRDAARGGLEDYA